MARREKRRMKRSRRPSMAELDLECQEIERSGTNKKKFSIHDLKVVRPKTPAQEDVFHADAEDRNLLLTGSPGTGKTFLGFHLAFRAILEPRSPYQKVVIIRSAVATRDLGALPGEKEDKIAPFEAPYRAICDDLFPYKSSYDNLKKNGYLEFEVTSFLRGTTYKDCVLIIDEAQNHNGVELYTTLSRVGTNCRVFIIGDTKQADLQSKYDKSALEEWLPLLRRISSIEEVRFTPQDVVRSGFVKELVLLKEEMGL